MYLEGNKYGWLFLSFFFFCPSFNRKYFPLSSITKHPHLCSVEWTCVSGVTLRPPAPRSVQRTEQAFCNLKEFRGSGRSQWQKWLTKRLSSSSDSTGVISQPPLQEAVALGLSLSRNKCATSRSYHVRVGGVIQEGEHLLTKFKVLRWIPVLHGKKRLFSHGECWWNRKHPFHPAHPFLFSTHPLLLSTQFQMPVNTIHRPLQTH
jgi:hypothetical protein